MGANILDRKIGFAAAYDGNRAPADGNGFGLTVRQVVGEPRVNPLHKNFPAQSHIMPVCKRASSDIMV